MFCQHCGTRSDDNAKFCVQCGAATAPAPAPEFQQQQGFQQPAYPPPSYHQWSHQPPKRTNTMAIAGLVLAFLMPFIGLIVSIIARKQCIQNNEDGQGLATAGIVISAVAMLFWVITIAGIVTAALAYAFEATHFHNFYL